MEHLKGMSGLRAVFLLRTEITEAGLKKLQSVLGSVRMWGNWDR